MIHSQEFGWLSWAKNGESAGTEGYSYRLEAIRIACKKGVLQEVQYCFLKDK